MKTNIYLISGWLDYPQLLHHVLGKRLLSLCERRKDITLVPLTYNFLSINKDVAEIAVGMYEKYRDVINDEERNHVFIGHSLGGLIAPWLSFFSQFGSTGYYIQIAAPTNGLKFNFTPPVESRLYNSIQSGEDTSFRQATRPSLRIDAAWDPIIKKDPDTDVTIPWSDHLGILFHQRTAQEIYCFLNYELGLIE